MLVLFAFALLFVYNIYIIHHMELKRWYLDDVHRRQKGPRIPPPNASATVTENMCCYVVAVSSTTSRFCQAIKVTQRWSGGYMEYV